MWEPRRLTTLKGFHGLLQGYIYLFLLELGWHLNYTMSANNAEVISTSAVSLRVRESGMKQQNNTAVLITRTSDTLCLRVAYRPE
jgi:hypothetical protein